MNPTPELLPPLWRILRLGGLVLSYCLVCCACQSLPQTAKVDFAEPRAARPSALPTPPDRASNTGSLFQRVSYRPAFEDPRARAVGDIITINIVETVTASQNSTSTADRKNDGSAGVTALPLLSAIDAANLKIGTNSENKFAAAGATTSANTFIGSISATVIDVLPNGHLLVTGEKQIGVNQNVDVLRFSGTVDPRLMQPGNIVNSTQVANARIESRGRGAQAEAQTVGWLTRFFFNVLPF